MPKKDAADTAGREPQRKHLIDHVEVTCEAFLGRGTITIAELDALVPGEMLTLDSSPADPAEIRMDLGFAARRTRPMICRAAFVTGPHDDAHVERRGGVLEANPLSQVGDLRVEIVRERAPTRQRLAAPLLSAAVLPA